MSAFLASRVGKSRCVVSAEALPEVTAVISIHIKVPAHFTELSAPLMVHHDLLFPRTSLQQSVELSIVSSVSVDEQGALRVGGIVEGNFLTPPAHKQTCRKVMKRLLMKLELRLSC